MDRAKNIKQVKYGSLLAVRAQLNTSQKKSGKIRKLASRRDLT